MTPWLTEQLARDRRAAMRAAAARARAVRVSSPRLALRARLRR